MLPKAPDMLPRGSRKRVFYAGCTTIFHSFFMSNELAALSHDDRSKDAQAKKCTSLDHALTAAKAIPATASFSTATRASLATRASPAEPGPSAETAVAQPGGRLIVLRAPNFGWNLALNLKIDGRTAANIVQGRRYDTSLRGGGLCWQLSVAVLHR